MTAFILTSEQIAEFARRGVLRIPSLLNIGAVQRAREHVLSRLARWHDSRCVTPGPLEEPLQVSKVVGNKHPAIGALLEGQALRSAVKALLDGQTFDEKGGRRPQVLVTLPGPEPWAAPAAWHVDVPRLARGGSPGVQLFTFLDTVGPRGGGTLVMAGSHRLLNGGQLIPAKKLRQLLRREELFRTLFSAAPPCATDYARLIGLTGQIDDVTLEVMELTGEPGDAYFTDLRVLHTGAPNTSSRPRLMATHRFVRADAVQELAHAAGWQ